MRFLVLFALFATFLAVQAQVDPFLAFAKQFHKRYPKGDMGERRQIFLNNVEKMAAHNKRYEAGEVSWYMKINEDFDLTTEEWRAKRTGGLPAYDVNTKFVDTISQEVQDKLAQQPANLPKDFSWVDQGAISSVKNQAACGSCAAFATMGSIETCFYQVTGAMEDDLSEQHILDCALDHYYTDNAGNWGAFGCDGAWPQAYFDWLVTAQSWNQKESSYPYYSGSSGQVYACNPDNGGYTTNAYVTGMNNQWYTNENDMINLLQQGPVVVSLQVSDGWGGYGGGVLDAYDCCEASTDSECIYNLNHAVLVVGYGNESGKDYWLIKNSWGTGWGESGYLKLKRGTGHCGVGCLHQTLATCAKA